MLESGEVKSLPELAAREGIDNSHVSRMVNLTTLAPGIVAAILDVAPRSHVTLFDLAVDPPALWEAPWERVRSVLSRVAGQSEVPDARRGRGCRPRRAALHAT
jgi:hypothetical protein